MIFGILYVLIALISFPLFAYVYGKFKLFRSFVEWDRVSGVVSVIGSAMFWPLAWIILCCTLVCMKIWQKEGIDVE